MTDPVKARAGRKGGKAPYKGNKGFAADPKKAQDAGRKGALKRWRKRPAPSNKPSALSKVKLDFEALPGEPKPKRKRTTKK